jgi:hypothetical protein
MENRVALYHHYVALVDEQLSRTSGEAAKRLQRMRVKFVSRIIAAEKKIALARK